jgi:hypothetical protein
MLGVHRSYLSMVYRLASCLFLSVLGLGLGLPAWSQQGSQQRQPSPAEIRRFVQSFQVNVAKGCQQNPPKGLKNASGYCTCYAKSFVDRYDPGELAAISNLAGASPQNAQLISVMMAPDQRMCRAAN